MALGLNLDRNSGPLTQVVKYNAKAGRIARVDRGDGQNSEVDITREFKAVVDWPHLETGWINFDTGSAPDFALTVGTDNLPERPSDKHRQGLRLMVYLHPDCAGGQEKVREIACTAQSALKGFDKAHNDYLEGVKANPDKLPVIVLDGVEADVIETPKGKTTNYIPKWKTIGWTSRPADLTFQPKTPHVRPASQVSSGATSTGSTRVQPPAPQPVHVPEAEAFDFG